MEKLFSYGTLQQREVQLATFGRDVNPHDDVLPNYYLEDVRIDDPEVVKTSGKEYHPIAIPGTENDAVSGVVLEITTEELLESDKYEVDAYVRKQCRLQSGSYAWVYVSASH